MPAFYTIQKRSSLFEGERKTRYYLIAKSWDCVTFDELTQSMVKNTSLTQQEAISALAYLQEEIPRCLSMGQTIDLGNLGHLQLAIRSEGSDTPEEATWQKIRDVRVVFVPHRELRREIRNLPVEKFPDRGESRLGLRYSRSMKKAKRETEQRERTDMALRCLQKGFSVELAAELSGLNEEQVEELKVES